MDDLKQCLKLLAAKHAGHSRRMAYYRGHQPLSFRNQKWEEVFAGMQPFVKNWCEVIVNSTKDRLKIASWSTPKDKQAQEIWSDEIRKCVGKVHRHMLTCGEAYIVAWPDDGVYAHDPRQCCILYDDEKPDLPRVGCKTWGDEKTDRLNLYYTDRIERYAKPKDATEYKLYEGDKPSIEDNPYGVVPVFRFVPDDECLTGELSDGVLSMQDALNKVFNDMMVSSEYCGFPQRWAIAEFAANSKVPIGPGSIFTMPPSAGGDQPVSVGTFATMSPAVYIESMNDIKLDLATVTRTPKHYFSATGGDPSGEALVAMEAPLIEKVLEYEESISAPWEAVMAFMLGVSPDDVEVIWADPHTQQPSTKAQTRLTNVQAGIPIINQLRDENWTDEQLDQLKEDLSATATATAPTVPSLGGLSRKATEEQTLAVKTAGKDATAAKAAPKVEEALAGATLPDDSVQRLMDAAKGKGRK